MKAFWSPLLALSFLLIGVFCSIGQSIRVESAYYGSRDDAGADVTQTVQRFADYGEPFRVNNDTLSTDPSPNHEKTLIVVYHANGQRISDAVPDGEVFYFRSGRENEYRPKYHKPVLAQQTMSKHVSPNLRKTLLLKRYVQTTLRVIEQLF